MPNFNTGATPVILVDATAIGASEVKVCTTYV